MSRPDLTFETTAQYVATILTKRDGGAAIDAAIAFERNLGYDCRKLLDRAEEIKAAAQ